ncbi:MAG: small basic family protein [Dehalococcoidia bacterium]|jgi:small basic protein|nr:small basic family protein [Dehalococcoidia bacterium]
MWWLPIISLLAGALIGALSGFSIPPAFARYTAIAILAGMDSVLGGVRSEMEGKFSTSIFLSGFFVNSLLAGLLVYMGDRLGVDLYLAALVAFGVRLFNNLAVIRRRLIAKE